MCQNRQIIDRGKDERGNNLAFGVFGRNPKRTPACPSTGPAFKVGADVGFAANQDIGQKPIGIPPRREDFIIDLIAKDFGNCPQKGARDIGVMFGKDVITDMFMRNAFDDWNQRVQIIDVARISQKGPGKGMDL